MNKFIGIGRLTKDPELNYSKGEGKPYTTFTIAINRAFDRDKADFLNGVTFGKGAESLAEYQRKGNQIAVEGSIQIDKTDDGKFFTKIVANNVQFLDPKNEKKSLETEGTPQPTDDSQLPF